MFYFSLNHNKQTNHKMKKAKLILEIDLELDLEENLENLNNYIEEKNGVGMINGEVGNGNFFLPTKNLINILIDKKIDFISGTYQERSFEF